MATQMKQTPMTMTIRLPFAYTNKKKKSFTLLDKNKQTLGILQISYPSKHNLYLAILNAKNNITLMYSCSPYGCTQSLILAFRMLIII